MKQILSLVSTTILAATLAACNFGGGSGADEPVDADLTIGVLVDESGSQIDPYLLSAAKLSAQNAAANNVSVAIVSANTQGTASGAEQALQELLDKGIRIVVGPTTSSEAQGALPLANAAGALLVSAGSTAQSLTITGDALYRLAPANSVASQVALGLLRQERLSALVTVNRQDMGDAEEAAALRSLASSSGISLQPAITYPTDIGTDFRSVANQVAAAVTGAGGSPGVVAVAVFGESEVADLLADCSGYPELSGVTFIGSDGVSLNPDIVTSAGPAFFARQAGSFPSPLLSVPPDQQAAATSVSSEIGAPYTNAYVLNGYDAVSILINAYLSDPALQDGGAPARQAFASQANGFQGLTGLITLNAAGDRVTGRYTYWGVCPQAGLINWFNIGSWTPSSPGSTRGTVSYAGCPS